MNFDAAPLSAYPEPYAQLCATLQDTTTEWRAELMADDLPAEEVTWRVRPGGQTIGAVMLHLIGVEIFWIERAVLGRSPDPAERRLLMADEIDVDRGIWPEPPSQPLSWYFELHDRIRARTLEAIKGWPEADAEIIIPQADHKYTPRWILGHVIQHEAYHGGQIVMLHDLWENRT